MKKILSVLLSVLLLLTMMPMGIMSVAAEGAVAAGAPTISLVAPEYTVEVGSTFAVDVVMDGNPGVICWRTSVAYDSTVLELVDQTAGTAFSASYLSFGPLHSPASAMWCDAVTDNNTANGVMYTLTFRVLDSAAAGTYPLTLSVMYPEDDILNFDLEAVYFNLVSDTVTVVDHYHVYDNACDADCNICGETREVEPHVYDNTCDTDCNVCGAVRTIEHTYTDVCDGDCNVCGVTRVPPHAYEHPVDTVCNLCGYVRDLGEVPTIYVSVPEDTVTIDGTFTVDVKVKNNPGVVAWHVQLSYDSSALELISATGGESYGAASFGPLTSPLSMLWVDAIHPDVTADGVLCTLTFRVLKDVDGAYDLTLSVSDWDDFFNNEFETVYFDLQGATLLTAEHTHAYDNACDVDCNVCGDVRAIQHTYDNACDTACNVCGEVREVEPHVYVSEVTTAPTCIADGVKTYTCSVCGDAYTEAIPSLGHDYESVVTAPTCEAAGYTTHTCTRCGDSYVDAEVPALGHNYSGVVTTEPTCIADGVKTYTCANCGGTYTEAIPALGHAYESVVTAPTCEAAGYTTHTCTRCGDSYVDAEVPALGHNYSAEVTTEPTCTVDGVKTYTCANCGGTYTEAIPASGAHTYEHACSESCSVCGTANDGAAAHTYNHVYDADCDVCGAEREVTILKGDLNGDGKVNIRDLGLLQQHLNGWGVDILSDVADLNNDGKINIRDLGLLQQYLNGWDVDLGG